MLSTAESLSYKAAEAIVKSMKRKGYAYHSLLIYYMKAYHYVNRICVIESDYANHALLTSYLKTLHNIFVYSPDTNELTLTLAGEVSDGKDKNNYEVKSIRYKVQTQYPWKGNGR